MGQYVNPSDIYNYEIYKLTTSDIMTSTVCQYITDTESLVDGKLANSYVVPFSTAPALIKKITRDIVGFEVLSFLHSKMNRNFSPVVGEQYKRSMELLNQVSEGSVRLILNGAVVPQTTGMFASTHTNKPVAVNMDGELDWRVPDLLLTDINLDRRLAD